MAALAIEVSKLADKSVRSSQERLVVSMPDRAAIVNYAQHYLRIERDRAAKVGLRDGKPQWIMLVDLWVSEAEGRTTSVSSLCIAGGVPPTTALRHIAELKSLGDLVEQPDPADRRRRFLRLSPDAAAMVEEQLRAEMKQLSAYLCR